MAMPNRESGAPAAYRNIRTSGNSVCSGTSIAPSRSQFTATSEKSASVHVSQAQAVRVSNGCGASIDSAFRGGTARPAADISATFSVAISASGLTAFGGFLLPAIEGACPGINRARSTSFASGVLGFGKIEDTSDHFDFIALNLDCQGALDRFNRDHQFALLALREQAFDSVQTPTANSHMLPHLNKRIKGEGNVLR